MNASDILIRKPTIEDLKAGADYAAITLPWTFNRMMLNTGSRGQQGRGLNIAKGIVAQEVLRRVLQEFGIDSEVERKSYRDDDLFDFKVPIDGEMKKLDLKTINYYTNYGDVGREPISAQLIADNQGYSGPDWRRFFPMLIPHTQINQQKEAYCFGIASSIDFRNDIDTNRSDYAITAFPFGEHLSFFSSRTLCLAREEAGKGIYLDLSYVDDTLFGGDSLELKIIGEWDGQRTDIDVSLSSTSDVKEVGPFSSIASFQIERDSMDQFTGTIEISVSKNDFRKPILNSTKRNLNKRPKDNFYLKVNDFCNLILPDDFEIYILGWTSKIDFLSNCRKYSAMVWPIDKLDRFTNQSWSQITEKDQ